MGALDPRLQTKVDSIRINYIAAYRDYDKASDITDSDIIDYLTARLLQRIHNNYSEAAIEAAIEDEYQLVAILKVNPHATREKRKKSRPERFFKRTLKILTDNDTSGYGARKSPAKHTAVDIAVNTSVDTAVEVAASSHASLALQSVNFISVPILYLYYYSIGEPVPFTIKNNTKMILSGIALGLVIVAIAFPPAAYAIMLMGALISSVVSVYAFGSYLSERGSLQNKIDKNETNIKGLKEKINEHNIEASKIKRKLQQELLLSIKPDIKKIDDWANQLQKLNSSIQLENAQLKHAIKLRHALTLEQTQAKTTFMVINSSTKVLLAAAVVAGIVLTAIPFTAFIGMIILGVTAAVGIGLYITNKAYNAEIRKMEKQMTTLDSDYQNYLDTSNTINSSTLHSARILDEKKARDQLQSKKQEQLADVRLDVSAHVLPKKRLVTAVDADSRNHHKRIK